MMRMNPRRCCRLLAVLLALPPAMGPEAMSQIVGSQSGQAVAPPSPADCAKMQQELLDWPNLGRYGAADASLGPPAPGQDRVVFLGDSITDGWNLQEYFPGKPYVNRGISGQTTPQMLIRFRQDVVNLRPKAVVILAGTNDIAGNTGPTTMQAIEDNFTSMAELAKGSGIRVVLASVLPAYDYPWRPGMQPVEKIAALNAWLRAYAEAHGLVYLDYYDAMQDSRHGLPSSLSADGVHPNPAGYKIMAPLAGQAISQALR